MNQPKNEAKTLTPKQSRFCQEYMVDLNATQAAIRAGYSKKTANEQGSQNLAKLSIQREIQRLMDERSKRTAITADYVLNSLKAVADRCMQTEAVMVKVAGELEESGEYRFDSGGANRALELLGKHLKLFTDKVEERISADVQAFTDEEREILRNIGTGLLATKHDSTDS